jgi:hypothetical protein
MQDPPRAVTECAYICGYDGGGADISVTPRLRPSMATQSLSDTLVAREFNINVIVGIQILEKNVALRKPLKQAGNSDVPCVALMVCALLLMRVEGIT